MADGDGVAGNGAHRLTFASGSVPLTFPPIPPAPTFSVPYSPLRLMGSHLSGPVDRHISNGNPAGGQQAARGPTGTSSTSEVGPVYASLPVFTSEHPMATTTHAPPAPYFSHQPPTSFTSLLRSEIAASAEGSSHWDDPRSSAAIPDSAPPVLNHPQLPHPSSSLPPGPLIGVGEPPPVPDDFPRNPVPIGGRGEGWPYAPQGWPKADDVWGWRVGKRASASYLWIDRYITVPKSLAKGRKTLEFASRKSLSEHLKQTFPQMNADSIFKAFDWKVPAPRTIEVTKGPSTKREKPPVTTEDNSWQRPKKRCQADNPHCNLETGKSSESGLLDSLMCHICCLEPGFCRECKCILCCKTFQPDINEITVIRCLNRPVAGEEGICGHAAHLECALNSQLAGVIKKFGLDVEYVCRRCDRKSDLTNSVTGLIEAMCKTPSRAKVEQNLQIALRLIQDPHAGTALESRNLATLIEITLKKVQRGADLQEAYRELSEIAIAAEAGRLQVMGLEAMPGGLLHHSKASLEKGIVFCSSPASQSSPALSNVTYLEHSQCVPTVRSQAPVCGKDNPVTNIEMNSMGGIKEVGVTSISQTKLEPKYVPNADISECFDRINHEVFLDKLVSKTILLASTPEHGTGAPKASAPFCASQFSQITSRLPPVSIEEHMKECEAIANRVKDAGQVTIAPARPWCG